MEDLVFGRIRIKKTKKTPKKENIKQGSEKISQYDVERETERVK